MPPKKPTPKSAKKASSADDVSSIGAAKEAPRSDSADSVSQAIASDDEFSNPEPGETVQVVVRMRPFNTKEKNEKRGPCIELDYKLRQVTFKIATVTNLLQYDFNRYSGGNNEQCRSRNPSPLLHL